MEGERNDLAQEAALLHPDRIAVMGRLAFERPESRSLVDTWECQPGMLSMRLTFHRGADRTWLTDGTADWFWAAAEHAGIAVMVFAPGLLPQIADVAARHQDLGRLVPDHLALSSDIKNTALGPACLPWRWRNIPMSPSKPQRCRAVTEAYPYPSLHAHIRRVVEVYGPHRVFWGLI